LADAVSLAPDCSQRQPQLCPVGLPQGNRLAMLATARLLRLVTLLRRRTVKRTEL